MDWWMWLIVGLIIWGVVINKEEEEKKKKSKVDKVKSNQKEKTKKNEQLYVEVIIELIAACIAADGKIEEAEIDLATSLIESDDLIVDKKTAIDSLKTTIYEFFNEREKSKVVFQLKMTAVIHKAKEIASSLQKDRILIILDGLLDTIKEGDRQETQEFIDKIKQVLLGVSSSKSKHQTAEEYILNSGDPEAIRLLREMQKNPGNYNEKFRQASKGNSIMRTALGVFTGVIAANLVTSAIYQHQLSDALSNFETELESMGGIDNFEFNQESDFSSADLDKCEDMNYADSNVDNMDGDIDIDADLDDVDDGGIFDDIDFG